MLEHFVTILREVVDVLPESPRGQSEFEQGVRFGPHQAGDLLLESLRVFDVPRDLVGADRLDPDRLLPRASAAVDGRLPGCDDPA